MISSFWSSCVKGNGFDFSSCFSLNNRSCSAVAEGCFCRLSCSHKPTAWSVPHILGILTVSVLRPELFLSAGPFQRVADLSFALYLWRYLRLLTSPCLSRRVVTSCSPNERALFTRTPITHHSSDHTLEQQHSPLTALDAQQRLHGNGPVCQVVPAWLPRCVTSSALCGRA